MSHNAAATPPAKKSPWTNKEVLMLLGAMVVAGAGAVGTTWSNNPFLFVLFTAVIGAAIAASALLVRRPWAVALTAMMVVAVLWYALWGRDLSALTNPLWIITVLLVVFAAEAPLAISRWTTFTMPRAILAATVPAVIGTVMLAFFITNETADQDYWPIVAFYLGPLAILGLAVGSFITSYIIGSRKELADDAAAQSSASRTPRG